MRSIKLKLPFDWVNGKVSEKLSSVRSMTAETTDETTDEVDISHQQQVKKRREKALRCSVWKTEHIILFSRELKIVIKLLNKNLQLTIRYKI